MGLWKLAAAAWLGFNATGALALDSEGMYEITEREPCEAEHIDSVIVYTDARGTAYATLTSSEYTIVYQKHALAIGSDGRISGVTTPDSGNSAVFMAELSEDGKTMTGTVDTVVCPSAWTFTAQRVNIAMDATLEPLGRVATLSDFVGSFAAATEWSSGTLRFLRLDADRVAGHYGTDIVQRLIDFETPVIDPQGSSIDLFSYDDDGVRVKWHLEYGKSNGVFALRGYGLSTYGRFYAVSAKKL